MTLRDYLRARRLYETHPNFCSLMYSALRRLSESDKVLVAALIRAGPPLIDVWEAIRCDMRYGFAVDYRDIAQSGSGSDGWPRLSDDCMPLVEAGARGRRVLAAAIVSAITHVSAVSVFRDHREITLEQMPERDALFRAARFLATERGSPVTSRDVSNAFMAALTPWMRLQLEAAGVLTSRLRPREAELLEALGPIRLARLREVLLVPNELLYLPDTWCLTDVAPTCGFDIVRPDEVRLPDTDSRYLASAYLWHAGGAAPLARTGVPVGHVVSARAIFRRHSARGWPAVFASALRGSGFTLPPGNVGSDTLEELVQAGLPRTVRAAPAPAPKAAQVDAVERTRTEFAEIRSALQERNLRPDIVDRLTLITLSHRRGITQRVLLTGESGTGKSYTALSVAQVAGTPYHLQDASGLVETGYRGLSVPDLLQTMYRAVGSDREALERHVLVLDEIEKTRIGRGVDGVSFDKRWGMQACCLSIAQGTTPITLDESGIQVYTCKMLVICAGAFSDADWGAVRPPTTHDLIEYGLIRELSERLRDRVFLPRRTAYEMSELLRRSDESVETSLGPLARQLGFELHVLPSTYRIVARMIVAETGGLGPRSGNQLLVSAAQRALLRALRDEGQSAGRTITVTPDDIDLPPAASR
jgi:hypothetical protein